MKINRRGWVLKDKEGYYVVSAGKTDTDLAKAKLYPSRSLAAWAVPSCEACQPRRVRRGTSRGGYTKNELAAP